MATKLQQLNDRLAGTGFVVEREGKKHHYTLKTIDGFKEVFTGLGALTSIDHYLENSYNLLRCDIDPQLTEVEKIEEKDNTLITQYEIYKPVVIGGEKTNMNITEIVFCSVTNKLFMCWFPGIHNFGKEFTFLTDEDNYIKSENDLISLLRFLIKDGYTLHQCSNLVYPDALGKAMQPEREEILQYEVYVKQPAILCSGRKLVANIVYVQNTHSYEINWLSNEIVSNAFSSNIPDDRSFDWQYNQIIKELSTLLKEGYVIEGVDHLIHPTALSKATLKPSQFTPQYNVMTNSQKQGIVGIFKAATIVYDNQSNVFKIIDEDPDLKTFNLVSDTSRINGQPNNQRGLELLLLNLLRRGFEIEYGGIPKYPNCYAYALEKYEQEQAFNQLRAGIMGITKDKQKKNLISNENKEVIINRIKEEIDKRNDDSRDHLLYKVDRDNLRQKFNNKIEGMIELAKVLGIPDKDLNNLVN